MPPAPMKQSVHRVFFATQKQVPAKSEMCAQDLLIGNVALYASAAGDSG